MPPDVGKFDSKIFNPQVFGAYTELVPRTKLNELLTSGVLRPRPELARMFPEQSGGNYAVVPMTGRLTGMPERFDGIQNMPISGLETYMRGIIVAGWQQGWLEKDFTFSITGKDFMLEIARQVVEFWDDFDQKTLIAILSGVFDMPTTGTGTEPLNAPFIDSHITDLSALSAGDDVFNETTLNTAMQKASGDNKSTFEMVIMHSTVATNLENKNLLERLKYTDAQGIQRSLTLGTLNGRTVLIDDSMPVVGVGSSAVYTSFILGRGAIDYADAGVKVAYEMNRDPKTNGGLDELLTRQRKLFAPFGISFLNLAVATKSPTLAELALGNNWQVVRNSGDTATIDIKAIPIAAIMSKG